MVRMSTRAPLRKALREKESTGMGWLEGRVALVTGGGAGIGRAVPMPSLAVQELFDDTYDFGVHVEAFFPLLAALELASTTVAVSRCCASS
jgi:hypothetical protein